MGLGMVFSFGFGLGQWILTRLAMSKHTLAMLETKITYFSEEKKKKLYILEQKALPKYIWIDGNWSGKNWGKTIFGCKKVWTRQVLVLATFWSFISMSQSLKFLKVVSEIFPTTLESVNLDVSRSNNQLFK